jgi:pimeloyl-ACP methyl ester carboxylesterase
VHGWPSTWYEWRHVMALLAPRHRLIVPDLRGLGDSSRPLDGYDKKTVAGGPLAAAVRRARPDALALWSATTGADRSRFALAARTPTRSGRSPSST